MEWVEVREFCGKCWPCRVGRGGLCENPTIKRVPRQRRPQPWNQLLEAEQDRPPTIANARKGVARRTKTETIT